MEEMKGAGGRAYFGPSDREDISAEALFMLKDEKPVFSAPGQEQSRPGEDHTQKPWRDLAYSRDLTECGWVSSWPERGKLER